MHQVPHRIANKAQIKALVRGCYAIQKLRIQTGNRIAANFRVKLGIEPSTKEAAADKDSKSILKDLRAEHKLITQGITRLNQKTVKFKAQGLITDLTEVMLIEQYLHLETSEQQHFKNLEKILIDYPIYKRFLKKVHGVGPAMAGVIISEIDIHKAEYPSSIHAYAGLDVAPDGRGRGRFKEHLRDVVYTDKDGNTATRKGLTFNPFLKTKLTGVLAPSFIKQGGKCPYTQDYYNYKHRLEHHVDHKDKTKLHRHNMALRYSVKRFLVDLYVMWRGIENLPVAEEYSVAKLGMHHKLAA